ncbi:MAG: metallophosphoesterase [Pyrinomonadaceae bacterium]
MPETDHRRRRFLKGAAAAGLAGLSGVLGYGSLVEPFDYELTETDIPVRDLPESFDNFRIGQLTDIHHSSLVPIEEVRRAVELANRTRPDVFVLTGDYTTGRRRYIEPCAAALGELKAPCGVWAVLGNHDHLTDAELTARALSGRGVNVLINASTVLRRGDETLQLTGVDDWGWGKADWPRAFYGLDLARPTVLLSHEPAVFDVAETRGISLTISGHTHGGQIRLPFIGAPVGYLSEEFHYLGGLYERGDARLYVSRGTGMTGLPIRLGARPEIAVLRLRRV